MRDSRSEIPRGRETVLDSRLQQHAGRGLAVRDGDEAAPRRRWLPVQRHGQRCLKLLRGDAETVRPCTVTASGRLDRSRDAASFSRSSTSSAESLTICEPCHRRPTPSIASAPAAATRVSMSARLLTHQRVSSRRSDRPDLQVRRDVRRPTRRRRCKTCGLTVGIGTAGGSNPSERQPRVARPVVTIDDLDVSLLARVVSQDPSQLLRDVIPRRHAFDQHLSRSGVAKPDDILRRRIRLGDHRCGRR